MVLVWMGILGCVVGGDDDDDDGSGDDTGDAIAGPTGPSRVESSCAPDDGGAIELVVGLDTEGCDADWGAAPHVRVMYWGAGSAPLAPGSYPFTEEDGYAWYDGEGGGVEVRAGEGTLTIDTWAGDEVSGSYELVLDGGAGVVAGSFTGPFCDRGIECG